MNNNLYGVLIRLVVLFALGFIGSVFIVREILIIRAANPTFPVWATLASCGAFLLVGAVCGLMVAHHA